jgi:mRNA interferase RelE/StbE
MYEIIFSKQAAKFVSKLADTYKNKIKDILLVLRKNPYGYPYKKIRGETNLYRIRVGKFRILYEIDKKNERIIIIKVDKRERIYE